MEYVNVKSVSLKQLMLTEEQLIVCHARQSLAPQQMTMGNVLVLLMQKQFKKKILFHGMSLTLIFSIVMTSQSINHK